MNTIHLWVPATFWNDHAERNPCDPGQTIATEVREAGRRVCIEADISQIEVLRNDAAFYAEGNVDGCRGLILSARATLAAIAKATA